MLPDGGMLLSQDISKHTDWKTEQTNTYVCRSTFRKQRQFQFDKVFKISQLCLLAKELRYKYFINNYQISTRRLENEKAVELVEVGEEDLNRYENGMELIFEY